MFRLIVVYLVCITIQKLCHCLFFVGAIKILAGLSASQLIISEWCGAETNADVSWVPIVVLEIGEPVSSFPSVTCATKLQLNSSELQLVSSVDFEVEFQAVP